MIKHNEHDSAAEAQRKNGVNAALVARELRGQPTKLLQAIEDARRDYPHLNYETLVHKVRSEHPEHFR
jgi:hypothetical protein